METDEAAQTVRNVCETVRVVADLHEFGVALYRQRMIREFGPPQADERVRQWLAEYTPQPGWRLANREWATR